MAALRICLWRFSTSSGTSTLLTTLTAIYAPPLLLTPRARSAGVFSKAVSSQRGHFALGTGRRIGLLGGNGAGDDGAQLAAALADVADVVGCRQLVILGAYRELAHDGVESSAAHHAGQVGRLHALGALDRLENDLHSKVGLAFEVGRLVTRVALAPALDEPLVVGRVQCGAVVDDAPDALGGLAQCLDGAVRHEADAGRENGIEQPELLGLGREIDGVATGQRDPEPIRPARLDLLDEGRIVVGAESGVVLRHDLLAAGPGRVAEALARVAPPGAIGPDDGPLAFLAGGKPGLDHGRVLRVRVIDAEHPRDTRVAGELVALVDRRYIQGVPAIEHRRHCQAFA